MQVGWNKDKDLDKAVWVNQVALFLQSFCFTIEVRFRLTTSNGATLANIVVV